MIKYVTNSGFVNSTFKDSSHGLAVRNHARLKIKFREDCKPEKLKCSYIRNSKHWPYAEIRVFVNNLLLGTIFSEDEGQQSTVFQWPLKTSVENCEIAFKLYPVGIKKIFQKFLFKDKFSEIRKCLLRDAVLINKISIDNDVILDCSKPSNSFFPFESSLKASAVRVLGFFNQTFGLAEAARRTTNAIKLTDLNLKTTQIPFSGYHKGKDGRMNASVKKPKPNSEEIRIFHFNGDHADYVSNIWGEDVFKCKYSIGFWHWESPNFSNDHSSWFSRFDEIWTPSKFCYNSIAPKSPLPVQIVPLALDNLVLNPPKPDLVKYSLPEDKFLFLVTFDYYSTIERKNPLAAIKAFASLISADDKLNNAHLVIKTSNHHADPTGSRSLQNALRNLSENDFTLIQSNLERHEILQLVNTCDALLSLHRAEGFGLHLAEAMAMGKFVIATNWSGNTDFMNHENSFPVDYKLVEIERSAGPYKQGNIWAEPDIDNAISQMRAAFIQKMEKNSLINTFAAKSVKRMHCPYKIAEVINDRLKIVEYHMER